MENAQTNQASSKIDPQAGFPRLYENELPRVYRYLAGHAGSRRETEDLTKEVFLRAQRYWPQLAAPPASPRAWLLTVANQCLADSRRQAVFRPAAYLAHLDLPGDQSDPAAAAAREEAVTTLLARLRRLPERDRVLLTLRFVAGLNAGEVGAALGTSEGAAVALLRALRRLHALYAADQLGPAARPQEEAGPEGAGDQERETLLAVQLAALLDGGAPAEIEPEVRQLVEFAGTLPWPEARPAAAFLANLRYKLFSRPAGSRRRGSNFPVLGYVGVVGLVAFVVIGALVLVGPRISAIFGTIYNSLDGPSVGYDRPSYSTGANPAPGATPLPAAPAANLAAVDTAADYYPAPAGHMVIKNAEVVMRVDDTDIALNRLTAIAGQYGGYILNSQTWYNEGYKEATIVISVPSAQFEQALNSVRQVASRVEQETASGQDVTDQYVDLESQLRNLEAVAARLRAFLDMAKKVEEALSLSNELARVEGQIEQVKGQMNYLAGRSAYSTISITLYPPRPTPTPTPPPTATPTPTPIVWQPGETAARATNTLAAVGRFTVEALLWIGIVVLPIVGVPALLIGLVAWVVRKLGKK